MAGEDQIKPECCGSPESDCWWRLAMNSSQGVKLATNGGQVSRHHHNLDANCEYPGDVITEITGGLHQSVLARAFVVMKEETALN